VTAITERSAGNAGIMRSIALRSDASHIRGSANRRLDELKIGLGCQRFNLFQGHRRPLVPISLAHGIMA
jgi:hypothetical protein